MSLLHRFALSGKVLGFPRLTKFSNAPQIQNLHVLRSGIGEAMDKESGG